MWSGLGSRSSLCLGRGVRCIRVRVCVRVCLCVAAPASVATATASSGLGPMWLHWMARSAWRRAPRLGLARVLRHVPEIGGLGCSERFAQCFSGMPRVASRSARRLDTLELRAGCPIGVSFVVVWRLGAGGGALWSVALHAGPTTPCVGLSFGPRVCLQSRPALGIVLIFSGRRPTSSINLLVGVVVGGPPIESAPRSGARPISTSCACWVHPGCSPLVVSAFAASVPQRAIQRCQVGCALSAGRQLPEGMRRSPCPPMVPPRLLPQFVHWLWWGTSAWVHGRSRLGAQVFGGAELSWLGDHTEANSWHPLCRSVCGMVCLSVSGGRWSQLESSIASSHIPYSRFGTTVVAGY